MKSVSSFTKSKERKYADWVLFVQCAFILFVKSILFSYFSFHLIIVSSLWKAPYIFGEFYLHKLAIALFLSSFIFIMKRKYLFLLLMLIVDAWCVANLCYYRLTGLLIDAYAISMIGNMDGFWGSSLFLLESQDLIFPILTMLLIPAFVYFTLPMRNYRALFCSWVFSFILHMSAMACQAYTTLGVKWELYNQYEELFQNKKKPKFLDYLYINPFGRSNREIAFFDASDFVLEIKHLSILHSPGVIISDLLYMNNNKYEMTSDDKNEVMPYLGSSISCKYDSRLVVLLLESFEDWVLTPDIMPNLYKFANDNNNVLYVKSVSSQIAQGSSSDGQFIINTGLLPCKEGAVVFRYPTNRYPAWAGLAVGKTAMVIPHSPTVWNQTMMSPAYGYDTTIVSGQNDEDIYDVVMGCIEKNYQVVQALTIRSHAPFSDGAKSSSLQVDPTMPNYMCNYIKCFNYSDACIGELLNKVYTDSLWANVTLVITGDHTILTADKREEFANWCKLKGVNYAVEKEYSPLIIYSKSLGPNLPQISDECYQMDIYPTILDLMELDDYYWRGVGRNLLMDTLSYVDTKPKRELSDKLIRSNYFEALYNQMNNERK